MEIPILYNYQNRLYCEIEWRLFMLLNHHYSALHFSLYLRLTFYSFCLLESKRPFIYANRVSHCFILLLFRLWRVDTCRFTWVWSPPCPEHSWPRLWQWMLPETTSLDSRPWSVRNSSVSSIDCTLFQECNGLVTDTVCVWQCVPACNMFNQGTAPSITPVTVHLP